MLKKLFFSALLCLGVVSTSFALGLDEIVTRDGNAELGYSVQDGDDESYALVFYYVGSGTQCTFQVSGETVTMKVPAGGTTVGQWDCGNTLYDTIGELVTAINADADFTCNLDNSDLLYSDDSSLCRYIASETDIGTDMTYSVQIDTAGTGTTDAFLISQRIPAGSAASRDEVIIKKIIALPKTAGDDIEIYYEDSNGTSTKYIDSNLASNSAARTYDMTTSGTGGLNIWGKDYDVIIKVNGTVAQAAGDYLEIQYLRR
jgi:hypothetical protein